MAELKNIDPFTTEGFESLCQYVQECGLEISRVDHKVGEFFTICVYMTEDWQISFNGKCEKKYVYIVCLNKYRLLVWPNDQLGLHGLSCKIAIETKLSVLDGKRTFKEFLDILKIISRIRRNVP